MGTDESKFASIMLSARDELDCCAVVLYFKENLTSSEISFFKNVFQRELEAGTELLIVHLCEVNLLYSIHIGNMVSFWKKFDEIGGELILCGLNEPVEVVLKRMGVLNQIRRFKTLDKAVEYCESL